MVYDHIVHNNSDKRLAQQVSSLNANDSVIP